MQPLFRPFRALGHISDDVPFAVQRRGKESFVTVSVGKAWQVSGSFQPTQTAVRKSPQGRSHVVGNAGVLLLQAGRQTRRSSGRMRPQHFFNTKVGLAGL